MHHDIKDVSRKQKNRSSASRTCEGFTKMNLLDFVFFLEAVELHHLLILTGYHELGDHTNEKKMYDVFFFSVIINEKSISK